MKIQNILKPMIFIMVMAGIIPGAEIYVSPTGKDGAAETASDPLGTIAAARDHLA